MKNFIALFIGFALLLQGCGGESHDHEMPMPAPAEEITETTQVFEAPDAFKNELESALDPYFELSSALVQANSEEAKQKAALFAAALQDMSDDILPEESAAIWSLSMETAHDRAMKIVDEGDIEQQRYHFEYLSEAMINTVRDFGPLSFTVYQQRCPMVRDGSADWLSKESGILNPYHGNRMLTCGSIVREL